MVVEDLMACKEAAEEFGYQFKRTKDVAGWPKGCYEADGVFFNQHVHGAAHNDAAQMCKRGGKGLCSFLASIHLLL